MRRYGIINNMIDDKRLPLKQAFLEYYRKLPIQKAAAAFIKKSEDTITDWKKEDQDFADEVERAKSEFVLERGKRSANEWVLERVANEFFKAPKQQMEVSIIPPLVIEKAHDNQTVPVADKSTG